MKWIRRNKHLILAGIWLLLIAPTLLFWSRSVLWVAFLSLYANFASEIAAHHAKRASDAAEQG